MLEIEFKIPHEKVDEVLARLDDKIEVNERPKPGESLILKYKLTAPEKRN